MRLIRWCLCLNVAYEKREGEIEVEDDATDEEIAELVEQEAYNWIDLGWVEVKEDTR